MADGNLNTTNILLGIMAAVSVLQALVLIGVGVFAFRLYRQALLTMIHHTMHRVDETADRVRDSIGSRISQLMGLVHGVICAVQSLFTGRRASTEAPAI